MISRRTLLVAGGAAVATTATGWSFAATLGEEDLVQAVLERYLGPISFAEGQRTAFVEGLREAEPHVLPGYKLTWATNASMQIGLEELFRGLLPDEDRKELGRFERELLAAFHVMTNFPWRARPDEEVSFVGRTACQNPFAVFT